MRESDGQTLYRNFRLQQYHQYPSKDARLKVSTLLLEKIDAKLLIGHFAFKCAGVLREKVNGA